MGKISKIILASFMLSVTVVFAWTVSTSIEESASANSREDVAEISDEWADKEWHDTI